MVVFVIKFRFTGLLQTTFPMPFWCSRSTLKDNISPSKVACLLLSPNSAQKDHSYADFKILVEGFMPYL